VGTKDPLPSEECSLSGRSKLYSLLSVSKIKVVCRLSLLWVQSGMSSMHVFAVFCKDPRQCGHGCSICPTSSTCALLWIVNRLWGLCPLLTLIDLPPLKQFWSRTRAVWWKQFKWTVWNLSPALSKLFACFHSYEYTLGCPGCRLVLYVLKGPMTVWSWLFDLP